MSYFFSVDGSKDIVVTGLAIVAAVIYMMIGWIASVPVENAVQNQHVANKNCWECSCSTVSRMG